MGEECAAYGADVRTIEGILPDAGRVMAEEGLEEGEFAISTFREPARVEGKKTMAFEIEDQLPSEGQINTRCEAFMEML